MIIFYIRERLLFHLKLLLFHYDLSCFSSIFNDSLPPFSPIFPLYSSALIGDNILYFGGGAKNSNSVSVLRMGACTYGKFLRHDIV